MAVPAPAIGAALVALLAFAVSGASYRAMVRSGNPTIGFVVAAFAVMGAKNAIKLALLAIEGGVPFGWELAFVGMDVATVALVAWPLFGRARG